MKSAHQTASSGLCLMLSTGWDPVHRLCGRNSTRVVSSGHTQQQQSVQPSPSCLLSEQQGHPKQNRHGAFREVQGATEIREDLNGIHSPTALFPMTTENEFGESN